MSASTLGMADPDSVQLEPRAHLRILRATKASGSRRQQDDTSKSFHLGCTFQDYCYCRKFALLYLTWNDRLTGHGTTTRSPSHTSSPRSACKRSSSRQKKKERQASQRGPLELLTSWQLSTSKRVSEDCIRYVLCNTSSNNCGDQK